MPIAENLRVVVEKAGGASALAYALGIRPPAIYGWTRVPNRFLDKVSEITGIPRDDLPTEKGPPPGV